MRVHLRAIQVGGRQCRQWRPCHDPALSALHLPVMMQYGAVSFLPKESLVAIVPYSPANAHTVPSTGNNKTTVKSIQNVLFLRKNNLPDCVEVRTVENRWLTSRNRATSAWGRLKFTVRRVCSLAYATLTQSLPLCLPDIAGVKGSTDGQQGQLGNGHFAIAGSSVAPFAWHC